MTNIIQAPSLQNIPSISHGFFTREGGVSSGAFESLNCAVSSGDSPANVARNYGLVAKDMQVDADRLVTCQQVHSDKVLFVDHPWSHEARPEADGLVTTVKGICLGLLTADCAPVLFADPVRGVIGAAHAGWRGAVGGIIENTIRMMEQHGATRANIRAAVGPCIHWDSYEVGAAFPIPFFEESQDNSRFFKDSDRLGHFKFDLPGYLQAKLEGLGLAGVAPSPADTYDDEERFYSYRRGVVRGEAEEGRMISCIVLK